MRSPRLRHHPPSEGPRFRAGDAVEVLPDDDGFRGAHFPAVVVRSHPKSYTVDYDSLVASEGSGNPLRETVPVSQVRPRPPPRSSPPAEHAAVDALHEDAWWLGVSLGGGRADGRVTVCFPGTREVMDFDAVDVRPHLEWVAGEWRSPEGMEIPKTMPYAKGAQVEVAKLEGDSVVAWFPATIAKTIWKNNLLVEYTFWKNDDSAPSKGVVDMKDIRPCPSPSSAVSFSINDEVEAFQGDGWWLGVITEVHPESRYTFKSAHLGKEVQLGHNALRLRYDWIDDQWKEVSQNVMKAKFIEGSKVEVSSDDEGLRGAWYQGTVLRSVGSKLFVEYDTLKDDDEITPLTEAIEVHNIRPSPPVIPVINEFKFLDEVDAFSNDGWWVGVISKVISDQSYMVYFKSWKEEKEFGHEQLRLHCDWVGGRWMRASLVHSISLSIFPASLVTVRNEMFVSNLLLSATASVAGHSALCSYC